MKSRIHLASAIIIIQPLKTYSVDDLTVDSVDHVVPRFAKANHENLLVCSRYFSSMETL